jgi:hypothetical protein
MDSIGIEATSATSGDVHSLSLPAVVGVFILVAVLALISSRRMRSRGLAVNHLFLKILLHRGSREVTGFVRTLDIDSMNLVLNEVPEKGEVLEFDLSSLPGFPTQGRQIRGTVARVKAIGDNHQSVTVDVTLERLPQDQRVTMDLVDYLRQLHT